MTPILLILGILIFYHLPSYLRDRLDYRDTVLYRNANILRRRGVIKLILFTLFLIYPFISSTVLNFFVCIQVDKVNYLEADFTQVCGSSTWWKILPYAVIMVVVYPIGIPVLFFFLLWRIKERIIAPRPKSTSTESSTERVENHIFITYGFLFEAYHAHSWYWEIIDMFHKLLLTSVVPFIPQDIQIPFALSIVGLYIITILWFDPYVRTVDDQCHQLVQVELICLLVYAYLEEIVYLNGSTNPLIDNLISSLLIILTILLFVYFVFRGFQIIRAVLWYYKRKQVENVEKRLDTRESSQLTMESLTRGSASSMNIQDTSDQGLSSFPFPSSSPNVQHEGETDVP